MSDAEKPNRRGRMRRAAVQEPEVVEEELDEIAEDDSRHALTPKKGRATTGRRNPDEEPVKRGLLGRMRDYFAGVRSELDKVAWPTREDVIRLVRIVVIVTLVAALVLGLVSFGFNQLFAAGLNQPLWFVAFGAVVGAVVFVVWRRNKTRATPSDSYRSRL